MAKRKVIVRKGEVLSGDGGAAPESIPMVDEGSGVPVRAPKGFAKADTWVSPEEFKGRCEDYFDSVDAHNRIVRKCAAGLWDPEKEGGRMPPFDAGDYQAYTHTGLALFLKLPSRVALAAIAGRGEGFSEVLDYVDLKIESCLVDGMLAVRGKFRAESCGAYLKQVLNWKGAQEKGGGSGGGTRILVVNDPSLGQKLLKDPNAAESLLIGGGAIEDPD